MPVVGAAAAGVRTAVEAIAPEASRASRRVLFAGRTTWRANDA
eukprot:CAMPEP_0119358100 /NCGR_PEP_ID=MMETSP1334-20130426/6385_1 /TAXON_ID=127549 /ORGANISM="Calcidiscus leptoporus, Strain RCC1130" /LENGTH=42 /DNA_ID= /DNA_START= /DNA_END= /DNA_ORIENTATION=